VRMSEERWGRPDASMSLLADLFAGRVADPGYAEAAARREPGAPPRPGRAGVFLALLVVGLLLVVAGAQVRRSEPALQRQRERLIDDIRARTAETDGLQRRLDGLRGQTERLRAAALARSDEGRRVRDALNRAGAAAAAQPVDGSALQVTIDDDPGGSVAGRIYDQDLQFLVNGLWAVGARAIGVNGQRLTATTAIRTAGAAILVDYRPLTPPYVVTALGDPGSLGSGLTGSAAGDRFRMLHDRYHTRFDVHQEGEARLPAAEALRLRYASPLGEP
jgi:uncharacterized protein YlxW (UPF0749 family)